MKKKVNVSWSGGKDCMMSLHKILETDEFEICGLHTVVDSVSGRVGMHGVPIELIEEQAHQLGFKVDILSLKASHNHLVYEELMREYYSELGNHGIDFIVFGDIFLEDLKIYRESLLKQFGLEPIFPLWLYNTNELIAEFLELKFKAIVCAVDSVKIEKSKIGVVLDCNWFSGISEEVDVCGENGEFHTFVFDGPLFRSTVLLRYGNIVSRNYDYSIKGNRNAQREISKKFYFQDLELDKKLKSSSIS